MASSLVVVVCCVLSSFPGGFANRILPHDFEQQSGSALVEHKANATAMVLHCNDFCVTCKSGKPIFVSRGQTLLQKFSKVMYVYSFTTFFLKFGFHFVQSLSDVLPSECPVVQLVQTTEGGEDTALTLKDDVGASSSLELLMKNQNAVYKQEHGTERRDGTLAESIEEAFSEADNLCGGMHGGFFHAEEIGWALGLGEDEKIGRCLHGDEFIDD